jgi:hypothetical protein
MAAPDGHDLVGVDAAVRLLARELLDLRLHGRHAGHAADEDDWSISLTPLVLGVVERLAHRGDHAVEQVGGQLVELRPAQAHVEVLGAGLVGGDERQVDLALLRGRQLDLGLLGGLVEALEGHGVLREVDALVAAELRGEPVDDGLVEVVAAEVVVPAVDLTSKTPSAISSTDTSNVPPPRSKTRIVWSVSLSRP